MTWRRRTWCLAKSHAKRLLKWAMLNELNWRNPEFNAHRVYTTQLFEGTILCSCGKHIRSNQEMIQHITKAFDVLKTHCFRASHPNSRGYKHVSQLWQQHHHRKKDRTFSNILDRWEKDLEYRKSPKKAIGWNDAFVRYLDHIVHIDISHAAPAEHPGR